jgi:hypothetical protein
VKEEVKHVQRAALKVSGNAKTKKQRACIKAVVQEAMKMLNQDEMEAMIAQGKTDHEEQMELMKTGKAAAPRLAPENLMETREESRQEK